MERADHRLEGAKPLVLAAGFLLLLQMGVPYAYAVLRPAWESEFGLSELQATYPYSAILAFYTLGMWAGGRLVDRFDPRLIGAIGALLFAAGFACASLAPTLAWLTASYGAACGFGIGLGYMAAVKSAVAWHPRRRGMAVGWVVLGFGLSSALLAPVLAGLIASHGWRAACQIVGGVFFLCSLPCCLALGLPSGDGDGLEEADKPFAVSKAFAWLWLGWALALAVGLGWLGQMADLVRERGAAEAAAAWLVGAMAVANGFARPVFGALSDRFGRLVMLRTAAAAGAVLLPLALLPQGQWPVWAAGIGLCLCFGTWLVNMAPLSADIFGGKGMGGPYGLLFTSYGVGALLGPLLIAWLREMNGGPGLAIAASCVLLAASCAAFWAAQKAVRAAS